MKSKSLNFLKIISWEYIQNLPVVIGFAWAYTFWKQGQFWFAVACMFIGGVTGAILIALTENKKVVGHHEPVAVIITNIIGMTVIMFGLVAYLLANWSSWRTDLLIGAVSGAGLGVVQSLAAKEKIGVKHCFALGIASALALISVHSLLSYVQNILMSIVFISLLVTLIISVVDYTL